MPPQGETEVGKPSGAISPAYLFLHLLLSEYSVSGLKSFDCFHCLMGGVRGSKPQKRKGQGGGMVR